MRRTIELTEDPTTHLGALLVGIQGLCLDGDQLGPGVRVAGGGGGHALHRGRAGVRRVAAGLRGRGRGRRGRQRHVRRGQGQVQRLGGAGEGCTMINEEIKNI